MGRNSFLVVPVLVYSRREETPASCREKKETHTKFVAVGINIFVERKYGMKKRRDILFLRHWFRIGRRLLLLLMMMMSGTVYRNGATAYERIPSLSLSFQQQSQQHPKHHPQRSRRRRRTHVLMFDDTTHDDDVTLLPSTAHDGTAGAKHYLWYYRRGGYVNLDELTVTPVGSTSSTSSPKTAAATVRVAWIAIPTDVCATPPSLPPKDSHPFPGEDNSDLPESSPEDEAAAAAAASCPDVLWIDEVGYGDVIHSTFYACCTQQAIDANGCPVSQKDELLVPPGTFTEIVIPSHSEEDGSPTTTTLHSLAPTTTTTTVPTNFLTADHDGYYLLVVSNCHQDADNLLLGGKITFVTDPTQEEDDDDTQQQHSYPPLSETPAPSSSVYHPQESEPPTSPNKDEENSIDTDENNARQPNQPLPSGALVVRLHLMGILSYLGLLGWFSSRIKGDESHHHHTNTVEEWIGRTIAIGLCAVVLRCLEYLLYDHTGNRHPVVAFITAFAYAAKHGLTRALLVGLSTGIGILPSRIGLCTLVLLVVLTLGYIGVVTALDFWAFVQDNRVDVDQEDQDRQIRQTLLAAKAGMEIIFWCWIWRTLSWTLADMRKLHRPSRSAFRYQCLFWILVTLAVVSGGVFVAVLAEQTDYGSVGLAHNRGLSQLDEICVFFMLLAAAILWRPQARNDDMAFFPGDDGDDDDLEMMMQSWTESYPDVPEDSPANTRTDHSLD